MPQLDFILAVFNVIAIFFEASCSIGKDQTLFSSKSLVSVVKDQRSNEIQNKEINKLTNFNSIISGYGGEKYQIGTEQASTWLALGTELSLCLLNQLPA